MCAYHLKNMDAYEVLREEALPDIHADGILLRHRKSGARIVIIPCEDNNKVFNIAFRTPPENSTGVAHIIEHTVLCGSRKFPLKDPFVELVKGSMNTFLNAMTYPDKTMFPVASTNDADFRNLMDVYLDAVFHPNIYQEEKIFRQEGWNYHLSDPDGEITYNGVVYNEMKGVYSSPDEYLDREISNNMFPDTTYGLESGGDPEFIPDLTYEAFLDFHRKYYHPSNSYICLYGNLDMAETLEWMDHEYLSDYSREIVHSEIERQKPFGEMRIYEGSYPVSDEESLENNTYLSWNAAAGSPFCIKEVLAYNVLDYALMSMPGAPVRQALLDAHIGTDVYGEYHDGILQPFFSIHAKNANSDDRDRFLQIIREELTKQVEQGIDKKSLLAGLHYLEFQFREADYSTYPKGLMYAIDLMDSWLYDENQPFVPLKQLDAYRELREEAENGYFEKLIRESLLENDHSVLVVLKPEKGLSKMKEQVVRAKLDALKESLTREELIRMAADTEALEAYQSAPEDPEAVKTLPMLKRSDLNSKAIPLSNIETDEELDDGSGRTVRAVYHEAKSNGIGYLELLWSLRKIKEQQLPYVSLLRSVLMNVDTEHYAYGDLTNEINGNTGGMSCACRLFGDTKKPDLYHAYFGIRCKALYPEFSHVGMLIREIVTTSGVGDEKRLYEIIAEKKSQLEAALQHGGNATAAGRAKAYYSPAGAFGEYMSGITFYRFLADLEQNFEAKKSELIAGLREVMRRIFCPDNLLISFTSEKEGRNILRKELSSFVFDLVPQEIKDEPDAPLARPFGTLREGFTTAGQVQYVAFAGNFIKENYPFHGAMHVLRLILSYEYLWQNVRVLGGAYGCSAAFGRGGESALTSYRDPNFRRTVEVFRDMPVYVRNFTASEDEMTKYVIGTMSALDTPMPASLYGEYCMRNYMTGTSIEELQRARDEVLQVTDSDIRALADTMEAFVRQEHLCVVGSEEGILKDADLLNHTEALIRS